jgi:hypothetical protein
MAFRIYGNERGRAFISIGALGDFGQVPGNNGSGATTGPGDAVGVLADFATFRINPNLTWEVLIGGTGSYTSFTINLEGSNDTVNWYTLDTSTNVSGEARSVVNKPFRYYRLNVSAAVVNSGSPTITGKILV